jgi:hypothetical protein
VGRKGISGGVNAMNIYETEFFCKCPSNPITIKYELRIESEEMIKVEKILKTLSAVVGYHEELADYLLSQLGGRQVLKAFHHGVTITTWREA